MSYVSVACCELWLTPAMPAVRTGIAPVEWRPCRTHTQDTVRMAAGMMAQDELKGTTTKMVAQDRRRMCQIS